MRSHVGRVMRAPHAAGKEKAADVPELGGRDAGGRSGQGGVPNVKSQKSKLARTVNWRGVPGCIHKAA
ncbi:hypothetical protein SBA_ch2_6880 [Sphingomonas bisphenolicum]|uniref:Uncharacterized protein n=1 Tax=Sphingomonas bisphenolicum TaxID=296544 RepID=A0ABN5WPG3_9SPHN|nr:hypothetical protein SBA_ch2_6880 [Sphingomonas bisphenolicum]